jgi:GntR family transcriptional regulator, transcriptional repressor for pyruvate dehydrogenase complex
MAQASNTRKPVSAEVFSQLRAQILGGELHPGEQLRSERSLTEAFGVNRHAVREALKRLQQAGLVEVSQGGATRVLDLRDSGGLDLLPYLALRTPGGVDPKVLRSALEMRISIGADAARLCPRRAEAPLPHQLLQKCEEMEATDDLDDLIDLDTEFWALVVQGADNIAYRLAFNSLLRSLRANQKPALSLVAGELLDHGARRGVAEAITARDEEAAERSARGALSGSLEAALDLLSRPN